MAYPGSQTKITITHDRESTADLVSQHITGVMSKEFQVSKLETLLNQIGMGSRIGAIDLTIDDGNAAAAVGSVTFSNFNTANDTFTLNGITLTCVASGATNNQWNVAASATAQATAFAAMVTASTTSLVSGHVTVSVSGAVVTFTSKFLGIQGNATTIAKGTDAGSVMTVSGARLTGGTAATNSSSASQYKHGV